MTQIPVAFCVTGTAKHDEVVGIEEEVWAFPTSNAVMKKKIAAAATALTCTVLCQPCIPEVSIAATTGVFLWQLSFATSCLVALA